jgi:prolyl oligopeptidase
MRKIIIAFLLVLCQLALAQKPPLAPSIPSIDEYHGVKITDEYRNLENLNDSTNINWLKKQAEYTSQTLKSKFNTSFHDRLIEMDKRNKFYHHTIRVTKHDRYFYLKMKTGDDYEKLYYRDGFKGEEILIFDPITYKNSTTSKYVISYYKPSNDGDKVAIALTEGGKEIADILLYDIEQKKCLPEIITNTWPSDLGGIQWLKDDSGFIYIHIPVIDHTSNDFIKNTQSVLYKLGTNPHTIVDIFSRKNNPEIKINPEDFPSVEFSSVYDNYAFAYLDGASGDYDFYYTDNEDIYNEKTKWKLLIPKEEKVRSFQVIQNELIYLSRKDNQTKLCKTPIKSPNFKSPQILCDNLKNEVIVSFTITKDGVYFTTQKNGVESQLYLYSNGSYRKITLPVVAGNITMNTSDLKKSDIWITCSGWTLSNKRYKYDIDTNNFSLEEFAESAQYPEIENVVIEEIEIKTHDGKDLPLTLMYKKGLKKNKKNKVIMDGYGSYGISNDPYFSRSSLLWVLDGGMIVRTHVRGGGEKGDAWHKDGFKETKPNTWKDMITSAEYLIKEKYTAPNYIGIRGVSAGGILIGRAITERPDLFKAALIEVGMLNAMRSENTPNGPNNVKEFGTVEKENEFKALLEMDAYHHIKKGVHYPATMITAGLNDPRVIAWEPAKFAAKLQAYNGSNNPIFLNVDMNGGHGGDTTYENIYKNATEKFSFFYWQLGNHKTQSKKK